MTWRWVIVAAVLVVAAPAAQGAEDKIAYLAHVDSFWQVWVIRENGGEPRQLTRSSYEKVAAEWYPDGRSLL